MLKKIGAVITAFALLVGTISIVPFGSMPAKAETTPYTGNLSVDTVTNIGTNFDATRFYMKGTDSFPLGSANGWNSTIIPIDDENSGIFINGERINDYYYVSTDGAHQNNVWLRKYTAGGYYIEKLPNIKAGDVVSIKGTFYVYGDWKDSSVFEFTPVIYEESMFRWDGSAWSNYEGASEDIEGYKGSLSVDTATNTGTNFDATKFYMLGTDSFPLGSANGWGSTIIPIDDENSGIFINGERINEYYYVTSDGAHQSNVWLRKYKAGGYYIEKLPNIQAGDIVTIKGVFYVYGDWKDASIFEQTPIIFEESKFVWTGSAWAEDREAAGFEGSLSVQGAQITTTNPNAIYLKGTDRYLADRGEDWEADAVKMYPKKDDADSGVWVDDVKVNGAFMKKYNGVSNYYYLEGLTGVAKDTIVTVKGTFISLDEAATVTYATSKFQWDGNQWIDYTERVVGENYKEKLSFLSGNASHMYLLPMAAEEGGKLMPDENWELALYPLDDASGLFVNDVKLESGYMKKVDGGNWYTDELGIDAGDKLVIKGSFGYSDNGHTVTFDEITLNWDGLSWTEHFDTSSVPCKDITLKGLHNVSGFSVDQNQWKLYITLDGEIPGEIDVTQFQGVEVDINGTVYKMQGAHSHEDTFYLGIGSDIVPQFPEENVKITVKAGRYVTTDKTTGVAIKKDFSLYITKYGISEKGFLKPYVPNEKNVKLSIDRDRAWGGNENGIYLLTEDHFPVDESWSTLIRGVAYDENSGVFYNGQKIDSILKKYEDGRIYVDLLAAGITAKDKDEVTIVGTFYLDDYAVSYKAYTLYYNGKAWNTSYFKQKVKYVNITGQTIHQVSWFDEPTKQWKVYIIVDGKLPGSQDAMSFDGLKITVNGKKLDTLTHHSHEGCLYFGIPEEYLSKDVKDGIKITVHAGKALAANRIEGIKWTKDFSFYTYMGSLTADKPTKNTKWQDITIEGMPSVLRFNKEAKRWNLFLKTNVELETEHTTQYLKLPVYLNGKKLELTAAKENEYLFVWIPEEILPENAGSTTFTIKKGATAVANAGKNGIRLEKDFTIYLYNGVWSTYEFDETIHTKAKISGVQNTEYAEGADGVNHWNIYLWADTKIPGTAWFEQYTDFTVFFNGKEMNAQLAKAYSNNSRLLHFPLLESITGKVKEGDIITIEPHTATCGGYEIEFRNKFEMIYRDGVWSQYVKSKVKEPKDDKSLWEMARFDEQYIPFTERGTVTFSSSDKYNQILSQDDLMDYTVSFSSTKLTDNTNIPGVSVVLRGNAIDEETPMSTTTLYGYVVHFAMQSEQIDEDNIRWIGCVNIWKNGRKDGLVDAYRIAYARDVDNPFYWFNEAFDYEFSIYNVTDTCVCITVKVNGEVVLRCYDEASDDPMDPAVNPGKFGVFAEDTSTIYDDVCEVDEVMATSTACVVGEAVWVSGSYPYVLEKTNLTVDSESAKLSNGVFKATEPGEYTISGSYDGKTLNPITITVSPAETEEEDETVVTEDKVNWLPLGIGAVVVVLLGAVGTVLIVKGKRKKKA